MLVVVGGLTMSLSPTGALIDRSLMTARFAVIDRPASNTLTVVEMDAQSTQAIKRWPWSRANYARVVDELIRAGASAVVFDVDLSSPADAAGDDEFAAALTRADGRVALPTFGQAAGSTDARTIDTQPLAKFRDHVALASVSISPDRDGLVRDMPLGTMTGGIPRPSLSAYIAGRSGTADAPFPIDMSIVPSSIPRLSFVAVRDGDFDPALVRGRTILIGATAVEMGDRYGIPRWGVIPGVVVQAMAAETLIRGIPAAGSFLTVMMFAALVVAAAMACRGVVASLSITAAGVVLVLAIILVAQHRYQLFYPLFAPLMTIVAAALAIVARHVLNLFRTQIAIDELTGLPNARSLMRLAGGEGALVLAAAHVDNYDALRAVLGARAAADVMIRTSERIALIAENEVVYCTAANQLTFLLPIDQPIDDTMHGLRAIMLQPVEIGGRRVDVSVCIGVAAGRRPTLERLLADASIAADEARREDRFWQRASTDIERLERSISLMGELDEAIERGQIEVFYQPKYNLHTQAITSVEALVRWRHPVRGFIGPDLFIPIAEKTNRIAPLTLHVLSHVVRDLAALRVDQPGITAAINISAKLLSSAPFNNAVEQIIAQCAVPTEALVFEVTESAAMSDTDAAISALRRYRALGIAVSMDDYGTGQSTLTYLRELPLNELKIDRSFVQFASKNREDALLVQSTIELAHQLGLKVVAEGVEDGACLDFLVAAGCDLVQGYLISRPLPLSELRTMLGQGYRYAA